MKIKILLLSSLLLLTPLFLMAQNDYDKSIDPESGRTIYQGQFDFNVLEQDSSFGLITRGEQYTPDSATLLQLKDKLPAYELIIVMGSWCSDSQTLIPQLYNLLQRVHFPMNRYQLFGTNKAKETKYIEHKLYKIEKVPTIIVRSGPQEIGRIVETVKESLEKDLLSLIIRHERMK